MEHFTMKNVKDHLTIKCKNVCTEKERYLEIWHNALIAEKGQGDLGFSHHFFADMRCQEKLSCAPPSQVEEGLVECRACGSKRVFCAQKQMRSADEPMTLLALCSNCGKRWTA